jgi:carboxymethylenebutenolidase
MGGHWALWLAQRDEVGAGAVVLYYAARAVSRGSPVPVLAHFAAADPFVSASGRRRMERSLLHAGWPYRSHDYPQTGHWFAESRHAAYHPAAAALALDRTRAFVADATAPVTRPGREDVGP